MGYVPVLRFLLELSSSGKPVSIDSKSKSGVTPLIAAAAAGHAKAVGVLLNAEASTGETDKEGWTALQHAAFQGHKDVCAKLLEM